MARWGSVGATLLLVLGLGGLASATTATASQRMTVTVDAAAQTDEGAAWAASVPVTKGDKLKITATGSGYYCQEDSYRSGCPTGPDGGAGDIAAYGCNAGQLIGKFGDDGSVSCLGSSAMLTAPATGKLELGFDDWPNSHGAVEGVQSDTGSYSVTVEILSSKVSGHVYDVKCGKSSCSQLPLQGSRVLVTGQASDGAAVNQIGTTGADGAWSVDVPPGSYDAGPTQDGMTIEGKGFDPQGKTLTVGEADVPDVDFRTCAIPSGSGSSPAARHARATAHAAAASTQPSMCTSIYTITVSAELPQRAIADPSLYARYYTGKGKGYNSSVSWRSAFVHTSWLRGLLFLSHEFPDCLEPRLVRKYSEEGATAQWYSYIKGDNLGRVKLVYAWNQSTQRVQLVQAPTVVEKKLVRVFKYRIDFGHGKFKTGGCATKPTPVPLLIWPATGGDNFNGVGGSNRFTLLASWGLPFSPPGVTVDPEGTLAERLFRGGLKAGELLYSTLGEHFEKLPRPARFAFEFAASYLLDTGAVKGILAAAPRVSAALRATTLTAKTIARIERFGTIGKRALEFWHATKAAQELIGFLVGQLRYPVMSAVIRGKFTSSHYIPVATGVSTPAKTNLALSVSTTAFPTISLTVNRSAYQGAPETGKYARKPPFEGKLPWQTALAGTPQTYNPFSGHAILKGHEAANVAGNPEDQLTNPSHNHHNYLTAGRRAVRNLLADMSQNPAVTNSVQLHGSLLSGFHAEQRLAPNPSCDADGVALHPKTICWTFDDLHP